MSADVVTVGNPALKDVHVVHVGAGRFELPTLAPEAPRASRAAVFSETRSGSKFHSVGTRRIVVYVYLMSDVNVRPKFVWSLRDRAYFVP